MIFDGMLTLDDRIYRLQQSTLPEDLALLTKRAFTLFLRDEDEEANKLVWEIEKECVRREIQTYEFPKRDI